MWTRKTQTLLLAGLIGLAGLEVAEANCDSAAPNADHVACDRLVAAADPTHAATQSVTAPATDGQHSTARTPLGDLAGFRAIAVDTLKIVNTGDFGAAKRRIKDLEVQLGPGRAEIETTCA